VAAAFGYNRGSLAMQTALVIDDDSSLRDTVGLMLENNGFRAVLASDGRIGLEQALAMKPGLILVDLRMPGISGVEVCEQLRNRGMKTPLIVLSAVSDEIDKVRLLEIGADDYIVKPFSVRELLARIHLTRRVVLKRGEELRLTRAEYNLLTYFLQNPDRALTRELVLNSVWGYDSFPHTRTVDAHVVRLRQKLEPDPGIPRHFLTVHGVGYRFLP
jgi:DNA-binding response OmpR family regulator